MNEKNYCTLEVSKKLHAAGIVIETDAVWCPKSMQPEESKELWLISRGQFEDDYFEFDPNIPRPNFH